MGLETILALLVLVGAGIRTGPMASRMQLEQPEREHEDEAEQNHERPAHVQVEDDGDATSAAPPVTTPPQPSE